MAYWVVKTEAYALVDLDSPRFNNVVAWVPASMIDPALQEDPKRLERLITRIVGGLQGGKA